MKQEEENPTYEETRVKQIIDQVLDDPNFLKKSTMQLQHQIFISNTENILSRRLCTR